jgi:hypothetical protein
VSDISPYSPNATMLRAHFSHEQTILQQPQGSSITDRVGLRKASIISAFVHFLDFSAANPILNLKKPTSRILIIP